ncbi:peptidoglycan DD-metalloendopeptidase family protein [Neptunomonas qingdaonensis]|uniref:peptidoglycan DD-metalloendopeptidase family protein n=1 Tax=Neptunomonas qingdaonensis TaxID=1045558 RepID=UPI001FD3EE8E|nr:peptidoglycan DD-metalloendopeptidase family protein [Neptunomonas qingdaonensis]
MSDRSSALDNKVELVRSSRYRNAPTTYRVKRGDTLYSIAWRYGLDYRELARANNIDQSFRINAGQTLYLKGPVTAAAKVAPGIVASTKTKGESGVKQTAPPTVTPDPQAEKIQPSATVVHQKEPVSAPVASKDLIWQWPAKGRVISTYSDKGNVNKGINMEGQRGEPVYAAAAGKVVYAGSGLLGYGNLIIINHNQEYLSAYAHNSNIFVKENENVNAGAKVAEIGNSGTTRTMLHFEIRKDGKPVNPLRYLPKR